MNSHFTPAAADDEAPLRRAIAELPSNEPDPDDWARLAARLAGEQAIAQALPHLPSHEPADDTWAQVTVRLDQLAAPVPISRPAGRHRAWPVRLGLAATVLLLLAMGVGQRWFQHLTEAPRLVVALPVAAPVAILPPASAAADPLDAQGEAFIDAHCSSLPVVCQSAEFQQLREKLTVLQRQEQLLRTQTQRRGATPQLVRQQVQTTIRKATVTRELIHLIIS